MKRFLAGALFYLASLFPATANVPCTLPFTFTNGTLADATQVMANYNALVTCLASAAAAGANSDITSLLGLTTPIAPGSGGTNVYVGGTSTGSANAQAIATVPSTYTLTTGYRVIFVAGFTNTGAATFNANVTGAKNVTRRTPTGLVSLTGGEVVSGQLIDAIYDGTQYQLLAVPTEFGGFGPLTNLASATTTDLGTIASHNTNITGVTTITSFGSSAATVYPMYRLNFAGVLLLTHNATSLILPNAGSNITTAANDTAVAIYLGAGNWQVVSYQRADGTALVGATTSVSRCGADGFSLTNNSGTPNTSLDISADAAIMVNVAGTLSIYKTAISATINTTVNGQVNRLDAGTLAANTWYHFWLISDGTTTGGLASTSATAPTLPSGYIYQCRLGAMRTDGSTFFYRTKQLGNRTQWKVTAGSNVAAAPQLVNAGASAIGSTTVPTWVGSTVAGAAVQFAPPTATRVYGFLFANLLVNVSTAGCMAAPNNAYGAITSTTNPPPIAAQYVSAVASNSNVLQGPNFDWMLEGTQLFFASTTNTGCGIGMLGWTDKVNAN